MHGDCQQSTHQLMSHLSFQRLQLECQYGIRPEKTIPYVAFEPYFRNGTLTGPSLRVQGFKKEGQTTVTSSNCYDF